MYFDHFKDRLKGHNIAKFKPIKSNHNEEAKSK